MHPCGTPCDNQAVCSPSHALPQKSLNNRAGHTMCPRVRVANTRPKATIAGLRQATKASPSPVVVFVQRPSQSTIHEINAQQKLRGPAAEHAGRQGATRPRPRNSVQELQDPATMQFTWSPRGTIQKLDRVEVSQPRQERDLQMDLLMSDWREDHPDFVEKSPNHYILEGIVKRANERERMMPPSRIDNGGWVDVERMNFREGVPEIYMGHNVTGRRRHSKDNGTHTMTSSRRRMA